MYKTELTSLQLGEGALTFHVAFPPPFPAAPRKAWYKLEDTANRKADGGKVTKKKKVILSINSTVAVLAVEAK